VGKLARPDQLVHGGLAQAEGLSGLSHGQEQAIEKETAGGGFARTYPSLFAGVPCDCHVLIFRHKCSQRTRFRAWTHHLYQG
jgi:hypothetical protein